MNTRAYFLQLSHLWGPSIASRANSPSELLGNYTFEDTATSSVLELPNGFADTSSLLQGIRESQIPPGGNKPVADDVTSREKSVNDAKSTIKHVKGLINFYLDTRNESAATLTGDGYVSPLPRLRRIPESTRWKLPRRRPNAPLLSGPTPRGSTGR